MVSSVVQSSDKSTFRKWQRHIQEAPGTVFALFAMLLAITCAVLFELSTSSHADWTHTLGSTSTRVAGIGVATFMIVQLVILKLSADRRSRIERDLLDTFLEHIPDRVYFKDRDSRFIRISQAMAAGFGLTDAVQAVNKTDSDMFSSEHAQQALADEREILRTGRPILGIEEKETWPDGREGWVRTTKVPLRNRKGEIIGTMGISSDITDHKLAETRIRHMAFHDALTGLPNRLLLEDRLAQAIALAGRNQKRVAVLMLDLDRFKLVNDSLGHHVGDRLLQSVAERLTASLRKSDIVARLGGDEFVIALPWVGDNDNVEQIAQKVLSALIEPLQIDGHELQTSCSIGICQYPVDGEDPQALLKAADAAMYQAKTKKRGTYCFFAPEFKERVEHRQQLENDLRKACDRGEFVLHYQPLVSTDSGRITGMEALLRWNHPVQGLIPPNQFIPLLEEMGMMVEVGRWVLRTACGQNVAWQKDGLPPIRVAVNVSAQQFHRGDIVSIVKDVLCETGLDPQWLELELTESMTLDETETTINVMHKLKALGVSLSLDDFGTGWSSLSYLTRFPLDRLKIDRSFMRNVASQAGAEAVVKSILTLARSLGMSCVGEGVETHQQLDYLQKQTCAEVQGFLYSPALPIADCYELLRSEESLEPSALPTLVASI
jgi:diguanylate cyclase (GGDEF)-like protein/PAS domain S-box-containing protein